MPSPDASSRDTGLEEADGDSWFIRDGIIVIPKGAVIPDGTVV